MTSPARMLNSGETDEELRIAQLLNRLLLFFALVLSVESVVTPLLIDPFVFSVVSLIPIAGIMGLRMLLHRGYVQFVSTVLLVTLWLLNGLVAWFNGGVLSQAVGGHFLCLIFASLLLGARGLWIFFGLSTTAEVLLLLGNLHGVLPTWVAPPPAAIFVSHVFVLFLSVAFLNMGIDSLQRARKLARDNLALATFERGRADDLLHNILPIQVADRLKQGAHPIAEHFEAATVLFADLVGFTSYCARRSPEAIVDILDEIFTRFDVLAERLGLEKIKTIGDAYMVVGGIPTARRDHVAAIAEMALQMRIEFRRLTTERGLELGLRIGIHCGPVVAGVIGRRKFIYDVWGDTVNTASRMESSGIDDQIQVSEAVARELAGRYECVPRGSIPIKGKGELQVYLLQAAD